MNGGDCFAACLVVLALWVLLSGLDDLFLQLALLFRRPAGLPRWPSEAQLNRAHPKRIAIFVPLWHEHRVIERMLEHNLAASGYDSFDFFIGVYPNDPLTSAAVWEVARRFPNVHVACCPHPGPTSKADCLNWIYQSMLLWEEEHGARIEVVVTHDAEDLIHPESLRLISYFSGRYDMVQVPVLPLPTPLGEWTHGLYCDEFAEYQSKDIPVRQALGGFLASNGVGTGFTRAALDELAEKHSNRIFEPTCLTEDYDAGFRIHLLGRKQMFLPLRAGANGFVATREYFPRDFRAAVKQRTRWVMGIALQGWERQGWRAPASQLYWLWRDRKGLAGNLLVTGDEPAVRLGRLGLVGGCVYRLRLGRLAVAQPAHGARFIRCAGPRRPPDRLPHRRRRSHLRLALRRGRAAPGRLGQLAQRHRHRARAMALLRGEAARPTAGVAQDGTYLPQPRGALAPQAPPGRSAGGAALGLRRRYRPRARRPRRRRAHRRVPAAPRQAHRRSPLPRPQRPAEPAARQPPLRHVHALPPAVARKWGIVPVEMRSGRLLVAGPELPTDEMTDELERYCQAEVRFQLVTPTDFRRLAQGYLA